MPKETLDTGMTPAEAVAKARRWWGEWRQRVARDFARERSTKMKGGGRKGPLLIFKEDSIDLSIGGIMAGRAWEHLTDQEQLEITKAWHHEHVRVPMIKAGALHG